jgi:hypothetical protein
VAEPAFVDPGTGVRREVGFFDVDGVRVFGSVHLPPGPAHAGVVVCPPLAGEFEKNYRRETLLADALAARGVAAQRFHYRGAGHSEGDARDLTVGAMRDDAVAAAALLAARLVDPSRVAMVGTRLGALAAASAADDGAPVALWEPALDADRYFREIFRLPLMRSLRRGEPDRPSTTDVLDRLRASGSVDVLGHTIGRPLWESARGRTLLGELHGRSGPTLLVQLGRAGDLRPEYRDVVDRLAQGGSDAQARVIPESEPWWFGEHRRGRQALTELTAGWLVSRLGLGS